LANWPIFLSFFSFILIVLSNALLTQKIDPSAVYIIRNVINKGDVHMSRLYPEHPIVAASGLVLASQGEILLVQRGSEPGKGLWSLPGGVVEIGETVMQAVAREIMEECGISVSVKRVIDVFDTIIQDPEGKIRYHYIIISYLAGYIGGEIRISQEIRDARWVQTGALDGYELTAGARDLLSKARKDGILFY
jgi:8-oxo-dGTP diphosphatase